MPTSKNNCNKNCSRSCDDDAIDDDNNERGSVVSSSYGNPLQYFVFIVGHCDEWPENRETQGDIGLYKAYERVGVSHDQMILLTSKKKLTKESCQTTLLTFLQSQTMKDVNKQFQNETTLLFYYGGHGTSTGFTTLQEEWKYKDVIDLIDGNFNGQRIIFMADCCGSGNLCNLLYEKEKHVDTNSNNNKSKKQYVCLANTAAYLPASTGGDDEEWIMNYCWIECLKQNICLIGHNHIPLYQILNILVDRNAIKLGDQLTIYLSPTVDVNSYDWLPTTTAITTVTTTTKVTKTTKVTTITTTTKIQPQTTTMVRKKRQKKDNNFFEKMIEYCYCFDFGFNEEDDNDEEEEEVVESYDEWKKQFENYSIPTKGIVSSKWTVGNTVFCKYTGGYPAATIVDNDNDKNYGDSSSSPSSSSSTSPVYVPPGWMRATILSDDEVEKKNGHDDNKYDDDNEKQSGGDTVQLLVTYPVKQVSWIVNNVCRNSLINDIHMGQMYMECENKFHNKVQCLLATKHEYIDYSIPPRTKIKARKNQSSNDTNGDTIIAKRKQQKNDDDDDDNGRRSDDIDGTTTNHTSHEKQQLLQAEEDVESEEAIILDWKDFDWKSYYNKIVANADDDNDDASDNRKKQYPSIQPCIPIRWLSNDKTELLPLELIIPSTTVIENTLLSDLQRTGRGLGKKEEETKEEKLQEEQHQEQLQRTALIASIESSGKTICNAKKHFFGGDDEAINSGGNDSTTPTTTKKQLIAYWPEDRGWYDVVPLDPETISLEILASHSQFIPQGLYCPLLYEDGVSALSPLHYVRVRSERTTKKKKNKRNGNGNDM